MGHAVHIQSDQALRLQPPECLLFRFQRILIRHDDNHRILRTVSPGSDGSVDELFFLDILSGIIDIQHAFSSRLPDAPDPCPVRLQLRLTPYFNPDNSIIAAL